MGEIILKTVNIVSFLSLCVFNVRHLVQFKCVFKRKGSSHVAPAAGGQLFPAAAAGNPAVESSDGGVWLTASVRRQGLSALHLACLEGELTRVQHLLDYSLAWVNCGDCEGRRPIHMVLSSLSAPKIDHPHPRLTYLLQFDTAADTTTILNQTPLHKAAAKGFFKETEILVKAGADVLARDNMGHTPWDLARIWGHRKVARYLKNCMWQAEKKKETKERTLIQNLYRELIELVKRKRLEKMAFIDEKTAEWANKKWMVRQQEESPSGGSKNTDSQAPHPQPAKNLDQHPARGPPQPSGPTSRPWTIFQGLQREDRVTEPDLRAHVFLTWDRKSKKLQFCTEWDRTPRPAPDLPLDVLERALFPRDFLSRLVWPQNGPLQEVDALLHLRRPQGTSSSPWTEVVMHLVEVLEPGHY